MNAEGKVIRSRATKQIGDTIEDKWRITEIKVIAAPTKGRPPFEAPRLGIYDYTVEPLPKQRLVMKAKSVADELTLKRLQTIANGIMSGKFDKVDPAEVLMATDQIFNEDEKMRRAIRRAENGPLVTFRTVR